jgi:enoyl-CoA hydratase/carnithine racemase
VSKSSEHPATRDRRLKRSFKTLIIERLRPGVVVARLNRPERLNAITFEIIGELLALCEAVASEPSARVLVVTGSGRGFCSGLDLANAAGLPGMSAPEMLEAQETWASAIAGFRLLPKPVIAAVNGAAAGAGFALALAADIRLASPAAKFNAAFVRIGLSGGDVGVSWMLPRIVGLGRAAEIMFTGRLFDAAYAERVGLVNEVVEQGTPARRCTRPGRGDLRQLAIWHAAHQAGPAAQRGRPLARGGSRAREPQPGPGDAHRGHGRGMSAFLDNRAPRFTGR